MDYIRFGRSGLRVSRFCLGTMGYGTPRWREWVLDAARSRPVIERALDLGINFFDMADFYSLGENEQVVGKVLLERSRRQSLVLASKLYYPMSGDVNDRGLSRKHILESIDAMLTRLGTDYLDLLLVHAFDPDVSMEETMEALDDVVRAGKVLYLGASTMYCWQFVKMNAIAERNGWARFINMQCQYSLLYREEEREMMPYCRHDGIAISTFSPLARGLLAGASDIRSRTDTFTKEFFGDEIDHAISRRVGEVAAARGVAPAQVAMAWVAHNSNVDVPIVGALSVEQLETAVGTVNLVLTPDERRYLEELYRPCDVINDHNPLRRPRKL